MEHQAKKYHDRQILEEHGGILVQDMNHFVIQYYRNNSLLEISKSSTQYNNNVVWCFKTINMILTIR
jgi:hypothetical protein